VGFREDVSLSYEICVWICIYHTTAISDRALPSVRNVSICFFSGSLSHPQSPSYIQPPTAPHSLNRHLSTNHATNYMTPIHPHPPAPSTPTQPSIPRNDPPIRAPQPDKGSSVKMRCYGVFVKMPLHLMNFMCRHVYIISLQFQTVHCLLYSMF